MATETRIVARTLGSLFRAGTTAGLTDGQLLERFATGTGEASEQAFLVLVDRHGPIVLRACRAILRDEHEAQDAFQATFLILARKGRSLWVRDSLGPWLLRVARRVAEKARAEAFRRAELNPHFLETIADHRRAGGDPDLARDLREEIDRLADRFRLPIVLCDLEGFTYDEAARRLGWSVATVKGRLARGRDRLRTRLAGRGFAYSCLCWDGVGPGGVPHLLSPAALAIATARAALRFRVAQAPMEGVLSISVVTLAEGAMKAMFLTRIKSVLLAGCMVTTGAVVLGQQTANRSHGPPMPATVVSAAPATDSPVGGELSTVADIEVARDLNRIDVELLTGELKGLREDLKRFSRMKWDAERLDAEDPARSMRLKDAQSAYSRAREAYLARARELRDVRKQLGEAEGVSFTLAEPRHAETSNDRKFTESAADASPTDTAVAIGSVDMDAILHRYEKARRASETIEAWAESERNRLNALATEDQKFRHILAGLMPGTEEQRSLEARLAESRKQLEAQRELLQREFSEREAQGMSDIYRDIQRAVARAARRKGMSYVVKASPELGSTSSPHEITKVLSRSILFADPRNDLTEEVLRDLNHGHEAAGRPKS